jgi:D-alanyl-D-alanine carboxypeptidase/D-alanyl-D-alanine-endopeptidase (penicillin-binding protein 4)
MIALLAISLAATAILAQQAPAWRTSLHLATKTASRPSTGLFVTPVSGPALHSDADDSARPHRHVAVGAATRPAATTRPAAASASIAAGKEEDDPAKLIAQAVAKLDKTGKLAGVSVIDLSDGKVIAAINADVPKMPASNQKLVTAAFAIARLGPDFKFTTGVYKVGQDILISGDGDPTLGDPRIAEEEGKSIYDTVDSWAAAIKTKVGTEIKGDILVVGSSDAASYRPASWPKGQLATWYAAPACGLNFGNNCFDVTFATVNKQIVPVIAPEMAFVKVVNELKKGSENRWGMRGTEYDSVLTLTGSICSATSQPVSVAADFPPLVVGRTLAKRLQNAGVTLDGTVKLVSLDQVDQAKAQPLATTTTPLAKAIRRANKHSQNMVAECIFLAAGDGTWTGGAKLATQTLTKNYGLPADSFTIDDGCGLSRLDRISPAAMTTLLTHLSHGKAADAFIKSLPICGVDGTMEGRLDEAPYKGRVLAKTGYIAGVSCLSGYACDAHGKPAVAFSVMVNGNQGTDVAKDLEDTIGEILVDWLED